MPAAGAFTLAGTDAAVLAVGTELTIGLVADTNGGEVARTLTDAGFDVRTIRAVPDDAVALAREIGGLAGDVDLLVVTGGLGPTHDDVTRDAAASALGCGLTEDPSLARALAPIVEAHADPGSASQVLRQALVLDGATVLPPEIGTAAGQVVPTARGAVALLPGPPHEMRSMLGLLLDLLPTSRSARRTLSCAGMFESDAQLATERVLAGFEGVDLTVLAGLGFVRVVLHDGGAGASALDAAADEVAQALGSACFDREGRGLAEAVIHQAASRGASVATAESCTGGLLSAALTAVAGASAVFRGGVIAYDNAVKIDLLGVDRSVIETHGAVSAETARAMARGASGRLGATHAVSVTGIAGPGGGTAGKPVGTVWIAASGPAGVAVETRRLPGDREAVRMRATARALLLLLRAVEET